MADTGNQLPLPPASIIDMFAARFNTTKQHPEALEKYGDVHFSRNIWSWGVCFRLEEMYFVSPNIKPVPTLYKIPSCHRLRGARYLSSSPTK